MHRREGKLAVNATYDGNYVYQEPLVQSLVTSLTWHALLS